MGEGSTRAVRRRGAVAILSLAVAGVGAFNANAATYLYTPVDGAKDLWSTGNDWSAVPVSATDTVLDFGNGFTFTDGSTNTNTNDISGQFLLTQLDLDGTGPATGTAVVNINQAANSSGLYLGDQQNIHLNATGQGLTYNIGQSINFGNDAATFFSGDGNANFNFNGGFTNTNNQFNFVKNGTSTLTIGGVTNSAGGVYSLHAGTIRLSGSGTLGSNMGFKFYDSGAALDLNGTNQTVAYIDLDASEDADKFVSGTIENNGTGTSVFTINSGYQPVLQNLVDHTNGGSGVLALTTNNNVTLAATNTYSGTTVVNSGTLTVGNGATAGTLGSGLVADNAILAFNRSDVVTVANTISGTGNVTQAGTGTTLLSGSNSYTGITYINAGTLALGSSTALGNPNQYAGPHVAAGATLDLDGQTVNNAELYITGTGVGGNGALINSSATPATFGGLIAPNNGNSTDAFSVGGTGNITLTNAIGQYPNVFTLTKVGSGTVTITGTADNFAMALVANAGTVILAKTNTSGSNGTGGGTRSVGGGVTVNGGLVQLGAAGGDQIYDTNPVTVNSGGFDLDGQNETVGTLNLSGTGVGGAGALVNSAAVASNVAPSSTILNNNPSIGVSQAAGMLTIYNDVSGSNGFTKVGNGLLVLNDTGNNYSGVTTISAGTIEYNDNNNQGSLGSSSITLNGGTLEHYATSTYVSSNHTVNVSAAGGTIQVAGQFGSAVENQFNFGNQNTFTGSGPVSVTGGYLRFSQPQSYSGVATIQAGAGFEYNTPNASAGSFAVEGDGNGTQSGSGELVDTSSCDFHNAVTVSGGILSFDGGNAGNFQGPINLTGTGATVGLRDFYNTGSVRNGTISGVISGSGGLTVNSGTGSGGTLYLTNTNTYSGNTNIASGTTVQIGGSQTTSGGVVTGSSTGTGVTTISSGASLTGSGGTADVVVNGTIAPGIAGTSPTYATLVTGRQAWNAGGTYLAKISASGSSNDQLQMSGLTIAATTGSPFTVQLNGQGGTTTISSPVIVAVDSNNSDAATIQAAINSMTLKLSTSNVTSANGLPLQLIEVSVPDGGGEDLEVSPTPEPRSFMLLGLAVVPLLATRRRRAVL